MRSTRIGLMAAAMALGMAASMEPAQSQQQRVQPRRRRVEITRDDTVNTPEIRAWNDAVSQKKAEKAARRAARA